MGYLQMTGQLTKKAGWRYLDLEIEGDFPWNHTKHREDDLIKLLCTNEFRELCRGQLRSGAAFDMFFKANDWSALYNEVDQEASEDEENVFEQFSRAARAPASPIE